MVEGDFASLSDFDGPVWFYERLDTARLHTINGAAWEHIGIT